MPPPQTKSIATYFKPVVAAATASSSTTPTASSSSSSPPRPTRKPSRLKPFPDSNVDAPPSAKRTKVVTAKQANVVTAKSITKPRVSKTTGRVTAKAVANFSTVATISLPPATSRADLRTSLESHPTMLSLLGLEIDTLGEDWLLALQDELTKPYFLSLKEYIISEQKSKKVFPQAEDIYSWSRLCPLKDIRIVIVGQDPYHDDGQAHGLAFSVRRGVRVPPSLRNIYKEMASEIPEFVIPPHGDLTEWAKHGVLLLNTSLTVRAHEAGSHANRGWEQFTLAVLRVVTARLAESSTPGAGAHGVVFMAWGAHAAKMIAGLDTKRHLVLQSAHPSPLSASRGFFGNGHFVKSNEWLEERYGQGGGINWKSLGGEGI